MFDNEKLKYEVLMSIEKNKLNRIWYWTTGILLLAIISLFILIITSKDMT